MSNTLLPHQAGSPETSLTGELAQDVTQNGLQDAVPSDVLARAYDLLQELLRNNEGVVSSIQLKRVLISKQGLKENVASHCIRELQFLEADADQRLGRTNVKVYHQGRSFVSAEKFQETLQRTEKEAQAREVEAEKAPHEEPEKEATQNRQEEARLGAYVKAALENIYDADHLPDGTPYVFDVHRERAGSAFENVDLIAVHWRSQETVDLVTVEVKLEFSAKAVHQACSYCRFSHRVWVACVVSSDAPEAGLELRSQDPGLFDYAVARGIGVLACRRAQGRSYQVFPIHWPAWQNPEPVEKENFVARYRQVFEDAHVLEKKQRGARY